MASTLLDDYYHKADAVEEECFKTIDEYYNGGNGMQLLDDVITFFSDHEIQMAIGMDAEYIVSVAQKINSKLLAQEQDTLLKISGTLVKQQQLLISLGVHAEHLQQQIDDVERLMDIKRGIQE